MSTAEGNQSKTHTTLQSMNAIKEILLYLSQNCADTPQYGAVVPCCIDTLTRWTAALADAISALSSSTSACIHESQ